MARSLLLILLVMLATPAWASEADNAKALFDKGVTFFEAGNTERALDYFLRSRDQQATVDNTLNVAICLARLERHDVALQMYETALADYADRLTANEKNALTPAMKRLRAQVGSLQLSTNVAGSVVVDGRLRGTLPLSLPVRLLAGDHLLRIIKDGYRTFETKIRVVVGETRRLDAKLEPLADAGGLRVEDPDNVGSTVFVDHAIVGRAPWEGTLGPGEHSVWTRSGDKGSAPTKVVVLQGQTALLRMRSSPLGPAVTIRTVPPTARLSINGADVGSGTWSDRLPTGNHSLVAREPGYHEQKTALLVPKADEAPLAIELKLGIDESHPRWPKPLRGNLWLGAFGGYALGPAFNGEAETECSTCPSAPLVSGPLVGLRGGYRFPFGLSVELAVAYTRLQSRFTRTVPATATAQYELSHDVLLSGPVAGFGASYRHDLSDRWALVARAMVGGYFFGARDIVSGTVVSGSSSEGTVVSGHEQVVRSFGLLLLPELGVQARFGGAHIGLIAAAAVFPLAGAEIAPRTVHIPNSCTADGQAGCTPTGAELTGGDAHDLFWVVVPQLVAGYSF